MPLLAIANYPWYDQFIISEDRRAFTCLRCARSPVFAITSAIRHFRAFHLQWYNANETSQLFKEEMSSRAKGQCEKRKKLAAEVSAAKRITLTKMACTYPPPPPEAEPLYLQDGDTSLSTLPTRCKTRTRTRVEIPQVKSDTLCTFKAWLLSPYGGLKSEGTAVAAIQAAARLLYVIGYNGKSDSDLVLATISACQERTVEMFLDDPRHSTCSRQNSAEGLVKYFKWLMFHCGTR